MTILSWTYLIVGLTFTLYIGIAIFTRVKSTSGFYIAGRGIPRRSTVWPPARTG